MSTLAIQTERLTKHFYISRSLGQIIRHPLAGRAGQERVTAIKDVTLQVQEGELFGLLGPNGAGKTTLIKLLCTLITPSSGSATVSGIHLPQAERVRQVVGMASGDERSFYWRLSGRQNLEFFASLYGLHPTQATQRIAELLQRLDLSSYADRPFRTYSSGQKQRFSIARALLHRPRVLFLDEPTRSLDPTATMHLHEFIERELLALEGMTIVLTTHRLDEAQRLCQRIAIMNQGEIRACGTPDELRTMLGDTACYRLRVSGLNMAASKLHQDLQSQASWTDRVQITSLGTDQWLLELVADPSSPSLAALISRIAAEGGQVQDVTRDQPTLEQVFQRFTEPGMQPCGTRVPHP